MVRTPCQAVLPAFLSTFYSKLSGPLYSITDNDSCHHFFGKSEIFLADMTLHVSRHCPCRIVFHR